MNYVSKLDSIVKVDGKITENTTAIAENQDKSAEIIILTKISVVVNSYKYQIEAKELSTVLKDSLIKYYGNM